MTTHRLKIERRYMFALMEDRKRFEVRNNDRDFKVGDLLEFVRPDGECWLTGGNQKIIPRFEVQSVWHNLPGVIDGFVVMDITPYGQI